MKKNFRLFWVVLIVLIFTTLLSAFFIFISVKAVSKHAKALVTSYKQQNFDGIKQELTATKKSLQQMGLPLNFLFWLRIIPFAGEYYQDAKDFVDAGVEELTSLETVFDFLEPSKSELGFNNQPIAGQDRISQASKILEKSLPNLDKIAPNLRRAGQLVENIKTQRYPDNFKGQPIKRLVTNARNLILGSAAATTTGRDILQVVPSLLGQPDAKNYLLLFQNDKEIRPTGGFITAYAFLKIDKGQISSTSSDDIYRLDEHLQATCLSKICPLTPPAPIVKYLPEITGKPRSSWSLRDSNISPDVPTAAKEFETMYQLLGQGLPFDGIVFIDSEVVKKLIDVTGPIDVLGTRYSADIDQRCNCPNVIYELENYAEVAAKGEQDRKAILGVLMQQVLARSLGADIEKLPDLLDTIAGLANNKHIIFYMHDQNAQQGFSKLDWTGEIKNADGDYLHINDSNFAGGKSNLYVEQNVALEINSKNTLGKNKITIEYKNPQPFGIWLNGINRDYVRFYVPKGSKLISAKGSENQVTITQDLDKTVFEAFITVRPQNVRKLEIEYTTSYQPKDKYKLLIQKQPGAKDFHYKIKLNGRQVEDFKLDQDHEYRFSL